VVFYFIYIYSLYHIKIQCKYTANDLGLGPYCEESLSSSDGISICSDDSQDNDDVDGDSKIKISKFVIDQQRTKYDEEIATLKSHPVFQVRYNLYTTSTSCI